MPLDSNGYWYPSLCQKQLLVYNCRKRYTLVSGPKKCVAGSTRLLNPITGEQPTIADMCSDGLPVVVMTLMGPVLAPTPFKKGRAMLLRVELECGAVFEATSEHLVLSDRGYVSVGSLRHGQSLLAYDVFHPCSNSGPAPKAHPEDDLRSIRIASGSQFGCPTCCRFGDGPLQSAIKGALSPSLPQDGALGHICMLAYEPSGAQDNRPERIHRNQSSSRLCSTGDLGQQGEIAETSLGFRSEQATPSLASCSFRQIEQSRSEFDQAEPSQEPSPYFDHTPFPVVSCLRTYWVQRSLVKSVTVSGIDDFYDIEVPGPNHYFAEGVIHHNSGKTIVNMHRLVRHAYETPNARIGMFAKTVKNAKCVSGDSIIQTGSRLKRMLRIVSAGPGKSAELKHVVQSVDTSTGRRIDSIASEQHNLGEKPATKIVLKNGFEITGSPDHPIWCSIDGNCGYSKISNIRKVLELGGKILVPIKVGFEFSGSDPDVLEFPDRDGRTVESIKSYTAIENHIESHGISSGYSIAKATGMSQATVHRYLNGSRSKPLHSVELTPDVAWLIGVLIGDGTIGESSLKSHCVRMTNIDKDVIAEVSRIASKDFSAQTTFSERQTWSIHSSKLKDLIRFLGINKTAHEKMVPDAILESTKKVLAAFISGLFDTDGTASSRTGYVSYCTVSEHLAADVQTILLALGIVSNRSLEQNSNSGYWRLTLNSHSRRFYQCVGFRCARKQSMESALPDERNLSQKPDHGWRDGEFAWRPIERFVDTTCRLFDITVPETSNYVAGGFVCHNSGGIWNDITEIAVPEWIDSKITRYTSRKSDGTYGVKQDPQSRMMYFRIRNSFGGNSEFQLHSIDNENEVESIAKGTRFSCFYFAELSNFKKRLVFDITTDQLRMPGLPFEDHMWLSDTNPADDGPDSWIYELWYKVAAKKQPNASERFLLKHLHLIEIMIEDNTFLSDEEKADLYARFAHDPDLAARYLEGRWVRAVEGALFSAQFKPEIHVHGNCDSINENDWDVILPSEHCHTLISGWDLGDKYHSAHIIEQVMSQDQSEAAYCVLDEVNHLDNDSEMGLRDFVEAFMNRYLFWEKVINREGGVSWRHWSDMAALVNFRAGAETYDKNLIYKYSGELIAVQGAPKFPGSVMKRVNMTRILLFEKRLFISARCFNTIEMFKALKKGPNAARFIADSKFRHVFDSLTYALSGEDPSLLMDELSGDAWRKEEGRLVTVALSR